MISLWSLDDKLWQSRRIDGKLVIDCVGPAEYLAFCRPEHASLITEACSAEPDEFPGWTRLSFANYETRKAALEKHGALLYEADVSPVRRYLSDNECKIDPPRRVYLDIETDPRTPPRVQAEEAPARILSWALVDEEGNRYTGVLEEDTDLAEAELLSALWHRLADYDQVAAWFGDAFDFPVIDLRTRKLARGRGKLFAPFWEHTRRLLFVDQALCFKRHHMAPESGDDKTSMKLNDVCQAILGEGKHDFSARKAWDYWVAGGAMRDELVAYNLQDTVLLPKLEAATGYLDLQQAIAEVTYTFVNSHGLKPVPFVDGYMLRKAHLEKTHLPSRLRPEGSGGQYEGAFVMPPKSIGIHENVHVCDFKSLYPTVIRSLNIGWETKDQLGCVAFGTEVSFGNETESMLSAACRDFMTLRDVWKKKSKQDPNDKHAERMSKAYKIANNSIYGVMGCSWSRYYDVQIAESITLGAKALIKATIEAAASRGYDCIYSDTDSCFVTGCTVDEFKEFVKWCNTELYPKMLSERGANLAFNCIELDYEKCFRRLVFPLGNTGAPAAKRYAGSYLHKGFVYEVHKPEIRGLEYMRGDGVRIARHAQKEAIDRILAGESGEQLEEWVLALRNRIMTEELPVEDIMISKGLGQDLESYSGKTNTAHVRLARELEARGEDVGQGTRIAYVIKDGSKSPAEVIPADEYTGEFDRHYAWNNQVYPATMRVLAGAYPDRNWKRWLIRRPKPAPAGQLTLSL